MKKYLLIASILGTALASVGCTAASPPAQAGAPTTMTGKLVQKGSMPMTYPILVRSDSEQWELQGVDKESVLALQNKVVTVEGTVVRGTLSGMLLPSLRVTRISASARK